MIIQRSQISAFSEQIKRDFEEQLTRRLLGSRRQDRFASFDDALSFVRGEIQSALGYGITSEEALEKYVAASWRIGKPIDQYSERLRDLLSDRDVAEYYRALSALMDVEGSSGGSDG